MAGTLGVLWQAPVRRSPTAATPCLFCGFRIAMIFREDAERVGWLVQRQFVTRHLCISVPRRGRSARFEEPYLMCNGRTLPLLALAL